MFSLDWEVNIFQDVIKDKDTSIRKFEQEVESLSFRNQQLASRVQVLQTELEAQSNTPKKHKVSSFVRVLSILPKRQGTFQLLNQGRERKRTPWLQEVFKERIVEYWLTGKGSCAECDASAICHQCVRRGAEKQD